MAIQVFSWLSECGSQELQIKQNLVSYYLILPDTIFKVQIRNICETFPNQDQGCQLLSKSIDNIDYIIVQNLYRTFQDQFFQVLATVRNKVDCIPI